MTGIFKYRYTTASKIRRKINRKNTPRFQKAWPVVLFVPGMAHLRIPYLPWAILIARQPLFPPESGTGISYTGMIRQPGDLRSMIFISLVSFVPNSGLMRVLH